MKTYTDRCAARPARPARPFVLLIACFLVGLGAEDLVRGQTESRPPRAGRNPIPDTTTAPQHASPNADYALSSLLSRTAPVPDSNDADIEINEILARRLWQNRLSAPDPNEDADIRYALRNLIQQVRSMTFEDNATEPAFTAPIEPVPEPRSTTLSVSSAMDPALVEQPTLAPAPDAMPQAALPTTALEQLENLLQDPNQVGDPYEMAELLFLSGRATEAGVFYEKALALLPADDRALSEDRAWILFQLGNCLRETNMTKARDTYMSLIAQYPRSPWTELAKAHGRLISWYLTARPQQLLPQSEQQ